MSKVLPHKVIDRLKQIWNALLAKFGPDEEKFVELYLDAKEKDFFDRMTPKDRWHAVNAARKILELSQDEKVDRAVLVKAALLHDIGKSIVHIAFWERALFVLLKAFLRPLYNKITSWGEKENSPSFFRKAFVYKNHSFLGSEMLFNAGVKGDIVKLVCVHSLPVMKEDSLEVSLLKQADMP